MSSISSSQTIVAEEKFSIYDTLPSLESWYQTHTLDTPQEESCLRRIRRNRNNKVVSFCPDPPKTTVYDDNTSLLSMTTATTTVGCCGNIKGT